MDKKIGRNEPCPCGSGKKFKKCCLQHAASRNIEGILHAAPQSKRSPVEPHLDLVPSLVWQGKRWRVVYDSVHYRPESETFHEFIINVVKLTLGETWWKHQRRMKPEDRHCVMQWVEEFSAWKKQHSGEDHRDPDGVFSGNPPGAVWALLCLGYDLFCLQAKKMLPDFLVKKLVKHDQFQGARYEVAAAAIMARSGFDIGFLDEAETEEKHCEFIATHRVSGVRVGVEAKSRVRRGVYHERGVFEHTEDYKGIEKLVKRAKDQKPEGLPFIIFVDVNLPPTRGAADDEKPWIQDVNRMVDRMGPSDVDNPDAFNALFVTNFAHHYGWPDEKSYRGEWGMMLRKHPETPLDLKLVQIIYDTVGRYDRVPEEV